MRYLKMMRAILFHEWKSSIFLILTSLIFFLLFYWLKWNESKTWIFFSESGQILFILGLLLGSGLTARDRRTGFYPCVATLPLRSETLILIRVIIRSILFVILAAVLFSFSIMIGHNQDHNWYSFLDQQTIYGLAGLFISFYVSLASNKESTAVGIALFISCIILFVLKISTQLYCCRFLVSSIEWECKWVAVVLLITAFFAALILVSRSRDPGSKKDKRVLGVLLISVTLSFVVISYSRANYLLNRPLNELDGTQSILTNRSDDAFYVEGLKVINRRAHTLNLYRIDKNGKSQLVTSGDHLIFPEVSHDGNFVTFSRLTNSFLSPDICTYIIDKSRNIRRTEHFETRHQETVLNINENIIWSPSDRWCAYIESNNNLPSAHFISPIGKLYDIHLSVPPGYDQRPEESFINPLGWLDDSTYICVQMESKKKSRDSNRTIIWGISPERGVYLIYKTNKKIRNFHICRPKGTIFCAEHEEDPSSGKTQLAEITAGGNILYHGELKGIIAGIDDDGCRLLICDVKTDSNNDPYTEISLVNPDNSVKMIYQIPSSYPEASLSHDRRYLVTRTDRYNILTLVDLMSGNSTSIAKITGREWAWMGTDKICYVTHANALEVYNISTQSKESWMTYPGAK